MKLAKIFTVFTFLLAFAGCVSAQTQTSKIVWKNLQEKYESFYDIKPMIINEGDKPIYFRDSYYTESVTLFRFDGKANRWVESSPWRCRTDYRPSVKKLRFQKEIQVYFDKEIWDEMTIEDSVEIKFKSSPSYNGEGKYKLKFSFGLRKSDYLSLEVFSPEFEVIEKDFKK